MKLHGRAKLGPAGRLATVNAALADGVPLVCIPDPRDQPDNEWALFSA